MANRILRWLCRTEYVREQRQGERRFVNEKTLRCHRDAAGCRCKNKDLEIFARHTKTRVARNKADNVSNRRDFRNVMPAIPAGGSKAVLADRPSASSK